MGVVKTIGYDRFPKQSDWVGASVKVQFNYDGRELLGHIIRDDTEEPLETLIQLEDGRVVRAVECQFGVPTRDSARTPASRPLYSVECMTAEGWRLVAGTAEELPCFSERAAAEAWITERWGSGRAEDTDYRVVELSHTQKDDA